MFSKKGAMFGLDARIALAIFGALSVISGAALYSAIEHSKVVALVAESNEIAKALEQYRLDTGVDIEYFDSKPNIFMLDMESLLKDNGVSGWNGPYLSGSIDVVSGGKGQVEHPRYDWFTVDMAPNVDFSYTPDVGRCDASANAGEKCMFFIVWDEVPASIAAALDKYVDGSINPAAGRVRYSDGNRPSGYKILYLRTDMLSIKQY